MTQTFTAQPATAYWRAHMGDTAVFISVDPIEEQTEQGLRVKVGFPVLAVAGWVKDPERFAARVAEVLTQHLKPAEPTPSPTGDQGQ